MSGAQVSGLAFATGSYRYSPGDRVNLISQANGSLARQTYNGVAQGVSRLYDVDVFIDSGALVAEIDKFIINPKAETIGHSQLASQTHLNRGANLVAESGLDNAWASAALCEGGRRLAAFSAFSYDKVKQSDLYDAKGWSLMTGLAWRNNPECGKGFLTALFFETGNGDYDGTGHYGNLGKVDFDGDSNYYGGGLLARYRLDGNFRLEAAVRAGKVDTDYKGRGHNDFGHASYDLNTWYLGTYAGAGWDVDLTETLNLDLTARYFWTRQGGKKVGVMGEDFDFENLDSHRLRTGARASNSFSQTIASYLGAYYEHEFDSRSSYHNSTANISHRSPKVSGGSGVGELGITISPSGSRTFLVDLAAHGRVGESEGYGGNLTLSYHF